MVKQQNKTMSIIETLGSQEGNAWENIKKKLHFIQNVANGCRCVLSVVVSHNFSIS